MLAGLETAVDEDVGVDAGVFVVLPVIVGAVGDASTALVRTWIG